MDGTGDHPRSETEAKGGQGGGETKETRPTTTTTTLISVRSETIEQENGRTHSAPSRSERPLRFVFPFSFDDIRLSSFLLLSLFLLWPVWLGRRSPRFSLDPIARYARVRPLLSLGSLRRAIDSSKICRSVKDNTNKQTNKENDPKTDARQRTVCVLPRFPVQPNTEHRRRFVGASNLNAIELTRPTRREYVVGFVTESLRWFHQVKRKKNRKKKKKRGSPPPPSLPRKKNKENKKQHHQGERNK